MRIISELTNQEYDSVDACLEAEALFKAEKEAQEALAAMEAQQQAEFKATVDEAYNTAVKAKEVFEELRRDFIKEYGCYTTPTSNANSSNVTNVVTLDTLEGWLRDLFSF